MSRLVTVDIGSFNIKVSSGGIFENRFITDNEGEQFGAETLIYNNNKYFFGKGTFDNDIIKAKKDYIVPLLYGLGKEGYSGSLNLILHLPPNQMAKKTEIIESLKGKTFGYKINNEDSATVTFEKVGILREGVSAFYSLASRNKGLIAVVDIGGRTTEVATFNAGVEEKATTTMTGTIDYFRAIAEELTGQGEPTTAEEIHKLIENNVIDLEKYEHITNKIFKEIYNDIQYNHPTLARYDVKICGGGTRYFLKNFEEKYPKAKAISDNVLTSNVDGAEKIGHAMGLDK